MPPTDTLNREIEALLGVHPADIAAAYLRRGAPPPWALETRARVDARLVELVDGLGIPRAQIAEALGWPIVPRDGRARCVLMDNALKRGRARAATPAAR